MDIIEQLEQGKENQKNGMIDYDTIHEKAEPSTEQLSTDPFEQANEIIKEQTSQEEKEEEKKPSIEKEKTIPKVDKYPGFDYNDYYEKGQRIFFVRALPSLGVKEFHELTIRTVYEKSLIGNGEKGITVLIGADQKDYIFSNRKDAITFYEELVVKQIEDTNVEEELGDVTLENTEEE